MGEPATAASDRYALAVVAFELLTGEKPFQAEHFAAQARAQIEDDPPRVSELAPELSERVDDVIDRGMAKDPDDRWGSAEEFVERLDASMVPPRGRAAAAGGTTATRKLPTRERTPPPPSRPARPAAAAAAGAPRRSSGPGTGMLVAGVVAALLIVVLGFLLLKGNGDDPGNQASDRSTPTPTATAKKKETRDADGDETTQTPEPTPTATATPTATPAPPGGKKPKGSPTELQVQAFNLNNAGKYDEALPLAQEAVAKGCKGNAGVSPCGYALYDLGRAQLGTGDAAGRGQVARDAPLALPRRPARQGPGPARQGQAASRSVVNRWVSQGFAPARRRPPCDFGANEAAGAGHRDRGARARRARARAARRDRDRQRRAVRRLGLHALDVGRGRAVRRATVQGARRARRVGLPGREPRRVGNRRPDVDAVLQPRRGAAVSERRRRPLSRLVSTHLHRARAAAARAPASRPCLAVAGRRRQWSDAGGADHRAAGRADPGRHRRQAARGGRHARLSGRGPAAPVLGRHRAQHHRLAPRTRVGADRAEPRSDRDRRRDLQLHLEHGRVHRGRSGRHLLAGERARHGRGGLAAVSSRADEQPWGGRARPRRLRRARARAAALRLGRRAAAARRRPRRRRAARRDGARRPDVPREPPAAAAQPRRVAHRRAQWPAQPAPPDERPQGCAEPRATRRSARCCSSISTASRPTTTRSATAPATRCSRGSAARWPARSRAAAPPTASAGTSSVSCSTASLAASTRS